MEAVLFVNVKGLVVLVRVRVEVATVFIGIGANSKSEICRLVSKKSDLALFCLLAFSFLL